MENFHLHEEEIYLISNHAVARNSIFHKLEIRDRFRDKMHEYLDPVSDVLAYNIKGHEFRILLRLKKREDFEKFYLNKYGENNGIEYIPVSTYIFSQQMSNLQVSLVKHFNNKFNRSGALMAGRFKRELISSEEEVKVLVHELESGQNSHKYAGIWADMAVNRNVGLSGRYVEFITEVNKKYVEIRTKKIDLVEQFLNTQYLHNHPPYFFLHRRFLNSICNFHSRI